MINTRNLVESLEKKYSIEKEEKRPLHESFVEEWWGQTDEDPFDFAYEYGLTCKKIGHNNDEDLYRFSGEKEDFDRARKDGYFYSLDFDADEGHSEDLNEALDKWVKLNKIVKYRDVADNFECDQHGNVRNAKTGRQLKAVTNQGGYSDLKYTVKTKEGKGKSVAKEQLIKEIEDSFIFSKLGEKEDLNESKELKEDADDIVTVSLDSALTEEDIPEFEDYLKNTFGIDIVKFDEFKRYDDLTVRGKKSAVIDFLVDYTDEDPEWVKETWHLNESKELDESVAGDIIWEKVRDVIREKIETEIIDNLAMVINSEVPEYNPDWCAESSNQSQWAADKLAEELATELMYNLD